ncbi:hypothetical protein JAAARDRAFT_192876 [Jaapia argillacea MUCL 33604]|uniref:Uncharacterized protein n=1 Tax=Jaapia argillacea MUCL 33604 TaxID=933084 RepID=A0A067PZR2_9AGAM|nr:hypothetical protein JAAARDRAFT_192876 [Jaapia argillacea MUCL 33604]
MVVTHGPHCHPLVPRRTTPKWAKAAALTAAQQKANVLCGLATQTEIDAEVCSFVTHALSLADHLREKYKKKPHYFLNLFFNGGVRVSKKHTKINPSNVFQSMKAAQASEAGQTERLVDVQGDWLEEYRNTSPKDLEKIVANFKETKNEHEKGMRVTVKSMVKDVHATVSSIQQLLEGLNARVGIDVFFCLVHNSPNFHMDPIWYFLRESIESYLKMVATILRW